MGSVALWHVGSSQTRHRSSFPCTDRWIPVHWTPREVLLMFYLALSWTVTTTLTSAFSWIKSIYVCVCVWVQSCLTLCDPWTRPQLSPLSLAFSSKNTEVGSHFLLQGILLTQGLNLCLSRLLHCLCWQPDSLTLAPPVFWKIETKCVGLQIISSL